MAKTISTLDTTGVVLTSSTDSLTITSAGTISAGNAAAVYGNTSQV